MDIEFHGLTEEQASRSREKYGSNQLTKKKNPGFFQLYIKSLSDPIIKILLIALGVTLLLPRSGGIFEAAGVAVSILVSTLVSTIGELGSERAFQKMQSEADRQKCTVIRGKERRELPITELAVGDLIYLCAGDKIPADGYIKSGVISCDQSALKGESKEVRKEAGSEFSPELSDISSVFRGSSVTSGDAVMRVSRVGDESYLGKVASEIQTGSEETPLRKKLSVLAGTLSKFGYFCAACVALSELLYSFFIDKSFVFSAQSVMIELLHALTLAVSVVVVAVPEGLPMMISVVLSSNVVKMQRAGVQVRRAVGIETAGCVNILFTDKTGTLTQGKPKVAMYLSGDGSRAQRSADLSEAMKFLVGGAAVFSSDCVLSYSRGASKAQGGNGTDRAIIDGYLFGSCVPKGVTRRALLPFNSRYKLSAASVTVENPNSVKLFGRKLTFVKGAPEVILERCRTYYKSDGSVVPIDRARIKNELEAMMRKGMRVVALASSGASAESVERMNECSRENKAVDVSPLFFEMTFIGFVGVRDELRRSSAGAIKDLRGAGVSVVMITGDSSLTAETVARDCGIILPDERSEYTVIDSAYLSKISDEVLAAHLNEIRVIARALPQDKSRLVRVARSLGLVTAMTGDGLNDAPALKQADVGFAMGSGTEVSKEAADIVITDDNISSIVRAVLYGRTVFKSIRKFIVFQLTMNLCAVGISMIGPFIGCESPVTVAQMLWINLIMDTLAALAFAGESPMKRYLKEKPLPADEAVLSGNMITRIFVMGIYTVMLCLFFHKSNFVRNVFPMTENDTVFLSGFFAMFVFSGIIGAFNARSPRLNIFSGLFINPMFILIMSAVFTVQIAMIYYGGTIFRCAPLSGNQLGLTFMLSLTVLPVGRLLCLLMGRREN